jgi:hypothetical protein
MKAAIIQPNYLPWLGYYALAKVVDVFILFDDVQFTRRDWRTRSKFSCKKNGEFWLTIPVKSKGNYFSLVNEIIISTETKKHWSDDHLNKLAEIYRLDVGFDFFSEYREKLNQVSHKSKLIDVTSELTRWSMSVLLGDGMPELQVSSSYCLPRDLDPNDRLIQLCKLAGVSHYISGPSAQSYIDEVEFNKNNVELEYFSYPTHINAVGYSFFDGLSFLHHVLVRGLEECTNAVS